MVCVSSVYHQSRTEGAFQLNSDIFKRVWHVWNITETRVRMPQKLRLVFDMSFDFTLSYLTLPKVRTLACELIKK